jgi:prepilin-type N-terminal cleavage/methylation domain-containing protein
MRFNKMNNSGMTLVEVVISLIIASILSVSLVMCYVYGIKQFNVVASKYQMLNEGASQLRQIEKNFRLADRVTIFESHDPLRSRASLHVPDIARNGYDLGDVEYYTNIEDRSLRKNNSKFGINKFHERILPMVAKESDRNDRTTKYPYKLKKMEFCDGDSLISDYVPRNGVSPYIICINMVLEDSLGNTVALSSTVSRMNR